MTYIPTVGYGPSSNIVYRHAKFPAERYYTGPVVGELLRLFPSEWIRLQLPLDKRCRPDVTVIGPTKVWIFELKVSGVTNYGLAQASRYYVAAMRRWPDREIEVFLVAPFTAPWLSVPPPGIGIVRFES